MKTVDGTHPPLVENPSWLRRLLNRFCFYETMSGAGRCPVYLERWTLFVRWGFGVYLHHFIGDDWSADPHDHPRRFITIGLRGWYWEDVFDATGRKISSRRYTAPWIRSFPAEHLHRVRASECGNCWTLVIVCRKSRAWGFVQDGVWIHFREYVFGGKARGDC